jgi:hypothetical protein
MKYNTLFSILILVFFQSVKISAISKNKNHFYNQRNPKRVINKEVRNLEKGKTDTISSLISISAVLKNADLKQKHRKKGIKALNDYYALAIVNHNKKIKTLSERTKNSSTPYYEYLVYKKIRLFYNTRIQLHSNISKLNKIVKLNNLENIEKLSNNLKINNNKLSEARDRAGTFFYEEGKKIMLQVNLEKRKYHKAYFYFREAKRLKSGFQDIENYIEKSLRKGELYVNILPISIEKTNTSTSIKNSLDIKFSMCIEKYSKSNPFVNISKNFTSPDYTVKAIFGALTTNNKTKDPKTIKRKKTIDEKEVTASITYYEKYSESVITGNSYIKNKNGKLVKESFLRSYYYWRNEWATYSGNKSALKKVDRRAIQKKSKSYPSPSEIVNTILHRFNPDIEAIFEKINDLAPERNRFISDKI